jgi:hypothetical protein
MALKNQIDNHNTLLPLLKCFSQRKVSGYGNKLMAILLTTGTFIGTPAFAESSPYITA